MKTNVEWENAEYDIECPRMTQIHFGPPPKQMKPTLIIYHRSDWDGKASKLIALQSIPHAETVGWDYGDPEPDVDKHELIYCIDISLKGLFARPEVCAKTIWIDHHRTAIADFAACKFLSSYLIEGVAACRLAYQYFHALNSGLEYTVEDYRARKVEEPLIITWLGEHDIWDHRQPEAKLANAAMDVLGEEWLTSYLRSQASSYETICQSIGQAALKTKQSLYAEIAQNATKLDNWHGHNWWVINTCLKGSGQFDGLDKVTEERDCMLKWARTPKGIEISLYTDNKKKDLSVIAKSYHGGGHPGACGFLLKSIEELEHVGIVG